MQLTFRTPSLLYCGLPRPSAGYEYMNPDTGTHTDTDTECSCRSGGISVTALHVHVRVRLQASDSQQSQSQQSARASLDQISLEPPLAGRGFRLFLYSTGFIRDGMGWDGWDGARDSDGTRAKPPQARAPGRSGVSVFLLDVYTSTSRRQHEEVDVQYNGKLQL
ncbi:hypothetical protein DENSPDRAFT_131563 [Dentipellis sp. KUC8613]|nr:hypothetical protein DENSPDRAFT_131563 [Dentipellis sp. KUC8613]